MEDSMNDVLDKIKNKCKELGEQALPFAKKK